MEIENFNLAANSRAGSRSTDPSLLREGDVKDWTPLVEDLKKGLDAGMPSPGRRVAGLLNEKLRGYIKNMPTASLLENSDVLRKELNKLFAKPDLYEKEAWKGIVLQEEARELLALPSRRGAQITRLNRLLIEAAWPAAFSGGQ